MNDFHSSLLKSESLNALVQNQHSHVSIARYTGDHPRGMRFFRTDRTGPNRTEPAGLPVPFTSLISPM